MAAANVVGLSPWFPWPLSRWSWLNEPIRAERLAAFRIGMGLALFLDVLIMYLPRADDFFGLTSLGSPEVFAAVGQPYWRWSLLRGVENHLVIKGFLIAW